MDSAKQRVTLAGVLAMTLSPRIRAFTAMLAPTLVLASLSLAPAQTPDLDKTAIEVQARGLIHEAFAQPSDTSGVPGPVVPKQPPDPIPEEPPEYQPQG